MTLTDCLTDKNKFCCVVTSWGEPRTRRNKIIFTATYESQERLSRLRYVFYEVGPTAIPPWLGDGRSRAPNLGAEPTISSQRGGGDSVKRC